MPQKNVYIFIKCMQKNVFMFIKSLVLIDLETTNKTFSLYAAFKKECILK